MCRAKKRARIFRQFLPRGPGKATVDGSRPLRATPPHSGDAIGGLIYMIFYGANLCGTRHGSMTFRHSAALVLLLLLANVARGEWTVISSEKEAGAAGVVHIVTEAEERESGTRATLHLAVFSTKTATLRVIDDGADAHAGLAETMQREKCIAGVNGGYFDPNDAPVGLLISDGRVVMRQQKARLLSGVLSVVNGRVQVQRAAEFSAKSKPTAARQCGPFLLERGAAVPGLNAGRAARRTFVAVGTGDSAAIGSCSYVSLAQLGSLLATPGIAGDLKIARALNLDGGSSSGFWFNGSRGPFSIREQKTVRDYVAVVPKA